MARALCTVHCALYSLLAQLGRPVEQIDTQIHSIQCTCAILSVFAIPLCQFWTCSHFILNEREWETESHTHHNPRNHHRQTNEWSKMCYRYRCSRSPIASRCLTEQRYNKRSFRAIYLGKTSILKNSFQISGNKSFRLCRAWFKCRNASGERGPHCNK